MKENKKFKGIYNQLSYQNFGKSLSEIKSSKNRTPEESKFLHQYTKYMPLLDNNSIMNTLAKYVEDAEFDNKWAKATEPFDWSILLSGKYEIDDKSMIRKIKDLIKDYNKSQRILSSTDTYISDLNLEDASEEYNGMFGYLIDMYEEKLLKICSNTEKLSDYVVYVYYTYYKNNSKSLMWNIFEDELVEAVKSKSTKFRYIVKDEFGRNYLGQKYSIREVDLDV